MWRGVSPAPLHMWDRPPFCLRPSPLGFRSRRRRPARARTGAQRRSAYAEAAPVRDVLACAPSLALCGADSASRWTIPGTTGCMSCCSTSSRPPACRCSRPTGRTMPPPPRARATRRMNDMIRTARTVRLPSAGTAAATAHRRTTRTTTGTRTLCTGRPSCRTRFTRRSAAGFKNKRRHERRRQSGMVEAVWHADARAECVRQPA